MQSAPATHRDRRPLRARLGALACLLAWWVGTPALLPAATALLGSLDGQHRIAFAAQPGLIAVVLLHPNAAQARAHRHSPLAEFLTTFARTRGLEQDHILSFAQTDSARLATPVVSPAPPPGELPLLAETFGRLPAPSPIDARALAPRPPPIGALALLCLRSTSLLV